MAGHSHWAGIKHKKAAADAKKGKLFSKLARQIMVAARLGGGDPDANISLQYAIDKAKAFSMPKDGIERAVKKGTGEIEGGGQLEGIIYEAIGPSGVFIMIEVLTDNRNRTASEIRKILDLRNARLGTVAWAFERKGLITVRDDGVVEDALLEAVLDAGAEDMQHVGDSYQITTAPTDLDAVKQGLAASGVSVESAEITQLPKSSVQVDDETGRKVIGLLEEIEDHEDVQNVYSNVDLPEALLAEMS